MIKTRSKKKHKPVRSSLAMGRIEKFSRHRLAMFGLGIVFLFVVLCVFAPLFTKYSPTDIDLTSRALRPGEQGHLLGTDKIGRDVWARMLYGGRVSITIGVVSSMGAALVGIVLGCLSGYIGGILDRVLLRLSEVFHMFPAIMVVLIVMALLGQGIINLCLVFILAEWMPVYRLVRNGFLSIREESFVEALRAMSIPKRSIMFKHILPLALSPVIVTFTMATAFFILAEAGLSFLGLGVPSGIPTWGNILNAAKDLDILTKNPWLWIPPGVAICLFVLGVNFVGDGLRDVLDPRQ
jgi:peptide/nickel transport system permease protein